MGSQRRHRSSEYLRGHFEEFVDEPILTSDAGRHSRSATALGPSELCSSPHSVESFVAQPGIRETHAWRAFAVPGNLVSVKQQMRKESWPTPQICRTALFKTFSFRRKTQFWTHPLTNVADEGVSKGVKTVFRLGSGKTGNSPGRDDRQSTCQKLIEGFCCGYWRSTRP
jgi:hypothetical protein